MIQKSHRFALKTYMIVDMRFSKRNTGPIGQVKVSSTGPILSHPSPGSPELNHE